MKCRNEECSVRLPDSVTVWPLHCSCGWRYDHDEDPGTPPLANRRGLGDVVSRVLGKLGILKRKGCNCSKRQAWLNSFRPR